MDPAPTRSQRPGGVWYIGCSRMETAKLNEMIDTAIAIEAKDGHLANLLEERARERGETLGETERREALELFEGYIRSVPLLLAAAAKSAVGTPVEAVMTQVIAASVAYWDEEEDLVPDHLGVLGLLDDAYFTLRILQLVSRRLSEESGHVLVKDDLTALDAVVCDIIGEQLADVLDELVMLSLSNTPVDELIAKVSEHAGNFQFNTAQTSFTGLSVEDLVDARLGFVLQPVDIAGGEICEALESLAAKLAAADDDAARTALLDQATAELDEALRVALSCGVELNADEIELAVSMLIGALHHRVVLTGGAADGNFIARAVEVVLEGIH